MSAPENSLCRSDIKTPITLRVWVVNRGSNSLMVDNLHRGRANVKGGENLARHGKRHGADGTVPILLGEMGTYASSPSGAINCSTSASGAAFSTSARMSSRRITFFEDSCASSRDKDRLHETISTRLPMLFASLTVSR